jgi:3-hydroxyisobutyrate dehydrogenase
MKIAWIGTGVMGLSMAGHLLKAGHSLALYSRTRAKAEPLLARGAAWRGSPAEAAADADAVCTMVGLPRDVEEVYLGPAGLVAAARPGALLIDFTTSSPSLAVALARAASVRGLQALDAPVSGGDIGARNAALSIMVGGDSDAFERARPLFQCLGKTVVRQGGPGMGQHAKMVNQIMIAGTMVGMCEGLLYARRSGLDPAVVLESVGGGAASSWSLTNLYPRILKGDLAPGFFVEHFIKDLQIALDEAGRLNLPLPGLALARQLYEAVRACGGARCGTQALILALERLAGADSRPGV